MMRLRATALFLLALPFVVTVASAQTQVQTQAQANDARARLGRFQPPPLPASGLPTAPKPPTTSEETTSNGTLPPKRPWRELTDSLLELIAPRALSSGTVLDDPLTTGFGNSDFTEIIPAFDPATLPVPSDQAAREPR